MGALLQKMCSFMKSVKGSGAWCPLLFFGCECKQSGSKMPAPAQKQEGQGKGGEEEHTQPFTFVSGLAFRDRVRAIGSRSCILRASVAALRMCVWHGVHVCLCLWGQVELLGMRPQWRPSGTFTIGIDYPRSITFVLRTQRKKHDNTQTCNRAHRKSSNPPPPP